MRTMVNTVGTANGQLFNFAFANDSTLDFWEGRDGVHELPYLPHPLTPERHRNSPNPTLTTACKRGLAGMGGRGGEMV